MPIKIKEDIDQLKKMLNKNFLIWNIAQFHIRPAKFELDSPKVLEERVKIFEALAQKPSNFRNGKKEERKLDAGFGFKLQFTLVMLGYVWLG